MTPRKSVPRLVAGLGLAVLGLSGCSEGPAGPPEVSASRDTVVLAFSGDSAGFRAVGARSGRILGRERLDVGRRLFVWDTRADSDERLMYAIVNAGTEVSAELVAVQVPRLKVAWRKGLEKLEVSLAEGTEIRADSRLVLSADGRRLYLLARRGPREPPGEFGVVPVDVGSRSPLGYLGGFEGEARELAAVRASDTRPPLLVVGGRRSADAARLMIYRDGEEGLPALRDSISLVQPPGIVVSARDGRHVYVRTLDFLFKVDVREGRIVDRGPRVRNVPSAVAVLRDPVRLVFTDWGFFESPGSGELQIYDGDLTDLGTLDIGRGAMRGIAVGPRGERVFVASGTPERFGGFVREASVAVVDVRKNTVLRVLDVGGFGVGDVHVF